ncbi:MAG: MoaD/ThiS family protein [Nitrososphaera sp.]|nr:MoaD/ThiS family protein [Nitrososphaera sp.]
MITIRLLGGAKKAVGGKQFLHIEKSSASVLEILEFLQGISTEPRLLQATNLIIAVNGVDSSALQGESTLARTGDTVTVVTVVHGGVAEIVRGIHVSLKGVRQVPQNIDTGDLLDTLRNQHKGVSVQAVRADAVFGEVHAVGILRIVLEAERRNVMLAKKAETEFLLRIAFACQISEAIKRVGLRQGGEACFVAYSHDSRELSRYEDDLAKDFVLDNSVINPTAKKKSLLSAMLGITSRVSNYDLLSHLLERAAILVR